MGLSRGGPPDSCGTFSPLSRCGIYRLPAEQLPAKLIVPVAFVVFLIMSIGCAPGSLLRSPFSLRPLRLHSPPPNGSGFHGTLFLLLTDCLFVLLVVIKVHVLISSALSYYNIIADYR